MIPEETVEEVTRLTRIARDGADEVATAARERRDALLAEHGYVARERETDETLVCYPDDWIVDGTVEIDRIDDTERAIERPLLTSSADWETVDARNREVVERVTEQWGETHGENVRAFADFCSNHYGVTIAESSDIHREEFLEEYYPRNAWPSKSQRVVVEESIRLALDCARQ
ncbi:DUF7108 family protein [Halocatena halophila]|uniref:DUF7108 family protein n=1 Tax=Halocatena halophila TaxID=2814576 RepID=UPI002ED0352D